MEVSSVSDSGVRFVAPSSEGFLFDVSAYGPIGTDRGSLSSISQAPLESSHNHATSEPSANRPGDRLLQISAISSLSPSPVLQLPPPPGSVTLSAYSWVSVFDESHPIRGSVSMIAATDGPGTQLSPPSLLSS